MSGEAAGNQTRSGSPHEHASRGDTAAAAEHRGQPSPVDWGDAAPEEGRGHGCEEGHSGRERARPVTTLVQLSAGRAYRAHFASVSSPNSATQMADRVSELGAEAFDLVVDSGFINVVDAQASDVVHRRGIPGTRGSGMLA